MTEVEHATSRCRTYSTLVMKHKQGSRLQQVIDWLGGPSFDGCIVLDEAHKAKSFVPGKEAQSSKVRWPIHHGRSTCSRDTSAL